MDAFVVGCVAESDRGTDTDCPFVSDKPSEIGRNVEGSATRPDCRGSRASDGRTTETERSADITLRRSADGTKEKRNDNSENCLRGKDSILHLNGI